MLTPSCFSKFPRITLYILVAMVFTLRDHRSKKMVMETGLLTNLSMTGIIRLLAMTI